MARVLVTEKIADNGLQRLTDAGHQVDIELSLSPEELCSSIVGAHGLIIRSATQVTAEVLEAADKLIVVGRAGIGLDNVDTQAATDSGVMVVNAPQSNVLSAAEHTMALLLSQARNVPQAHAALKEGRWERSQWNGVELADKTMGVIGLGRIGKLVAQRCLAFGMNLVAYDPFVTEDAAARMSVELLPLEDVMKRSDFITLHVANTPETAGLIDAKLLALAKPDMRLINVARGGIVVEQDLADAVSNGVIGGAAIDVFDSEPCTESPLFGVDKIVVTPHLGASTREAQDKAGDTIAEMVELALNGDFVPFAVNVEAGDVSEFVRPFQSLAERLGSIVAQLSGDELQSTPIEISYEGEIGNYDTRILTLSVLKGFFGAELEDSVSYVNAPQLATDRGIDVRPTTSVTARDYVNLVTISTGGHSVSGTLSGLGAAQRIVSIDGFHLDVPPAQNMLVVRNEDVPGIIGIVGTLVGESGVNISDMVVGKDDSGSSALMILVTDNSPPNDVLSALQGHSSISSVTAVQA